MAKAGPSVSQSVLIHGPIGANTNPSSDGRPSLSSWEFVYRSRTRMIPARCTCTTQSLVLSGAFEDHVTPCIRFISMALTSPDPSRRPSFKSTHLLNPSSTLSTPITTVRYRCGSISSPDIVPARGEIIAALMTITHQSGQQTAPFSFAVTARPPDACRKRTPLPSNVCATRRLEVGSSWHESS